MSEVLTPKNPLPKASSWLYSLWKFSRPHTIIGTSLSVLGLYLIALSDKISIWDARESVPLCLTSLVISWIACLCGNVYIVGLNQLEDIEIDQINKPHLPLAAGEYSPTQAQFLIAITGILALILAGFQGQFLLATVTISLILGTAYSLPPIRLKRFPFWAAFCIFTVRGVIVNLGIFLHFQQIFSPEISPLITPSVWALTLFVLVFTFAIAIFKDIPDIDGDRQYNITTLTIRLGSRTVFNLARWVLTFCYVGMIASSLILKPDVNPMILSLTHLAALSVMLWRSTTVNLESKSEITQYYQFIWKLFFLEYLMFPVACLLG
jgi:homogentisate phytyltransferase/homogentisate geranylgeranyltransferase